MNRLRRWPAAAGALVLVLTIGFGAGVYADQAYPDQVPPLFLRAPRSQLDSAQLAQALRIIQADYYERHLDYKKLSHGTIQGLVQALSDPYSSYLDPQAYQAQQKNLQGSHTGMIGIAVSFLNGYPVVSSLLPNSPAQKAGLHGGDVIVRVDGKDTQGLNAEQTAALIRGPSGTQVVLSVQRAGTVQDVSVPRLDFTSPSVVSLELQGGILYTRVYQFANDTESALDGQLRQYLPGSRGIVLDLRDNPGGLVDAATHTVSQFLSEGEAFEQRDGRGRIEKTEVTGDHLAPGIPLVVLVNGASASASEITAGALQARGRAKLVGVKTFGKGSVQVDFPLKDGSDLHLTIKHWFLPNGQSVDRLGLMPDYAVPLPDPGAMFDVVDAARGHAGDAQLNRALTLLGAG